MDGHGHDGHTHTLEKIKILYGQRNMYLCFTTLFLSLVLDRFIKMSYKLSKVKEELRLLKEEQLGGQPKADVPLKEIKKKPEEIPLTKRKEDKKAQ